MKTDLLKLTVSELLAMNRGFVASGDAVIIMNDALEELARRASRSEGIPAAFRKRLIQVWCEGYLCTGMEGVPAPASLLGEVEATTLDEACQILHDRVPKQERNDYSRSADGRWAYWGCRIYDNREDASKAFG